MSFPAYPVYKDSGVEWLGSVPEHWAIFSLKRSVDGCTNGLWGDEPDGENDLAVIRVADFDRATCRVGLDKLTYRSITQKERASRLLQSGDLLIEKSGGGEKTLVGCVVLFEHDFEAITSNFVARMRPLHGFDSGFLCYSFDSLYQGKVNFPAIKQTTGIQNLDSESYLQERFCFPTLAEQTQIARFLDHETARIDALIEEQQRLIELLKEKRQAVISHAVTKGLDPTVPMKDSGVEWLGEVPAHWKVTPLKHVVATPITDGPHETPEFIDDGVLFVSAEAVSSGNINFSKARYISREDHLRYSKKYRPQKFDIYMVKSGATTGVTAIVETDDEFNIWSPLAVVRCKPEHSPYFVLFAMRSRNFQESVVVNWSFGTQQNIGMNVIENLPIACPPADEQKEIAAFIAQESEKWDSLISEGVSAVHLLQERRSALISAAVTGKIDVRNW
ncbi:MAG: restriction endonuclease subunit S [Halopseudomonas aestusnigri]|nr:restriction endonuclease subunit S [Halopseudomonas aestusnigri]